MDSFLQVENPEGKERMLIFLSALGVDRIA
jgi:hypothetical protein